MFVKISKINTFKWTFWSQISSCCPFYSVPNSIRNYHTRFKIDRTVLTLIIQKSQIVMLKMDILTFWQGWQSETGIRQSFHKLSGIRIRNFIFGFGFQFFLIEFYDKKIFGGLPSLLFGND